MSVVECDVPPSSVLDRDVVEAAYFRDSYRSRLRRADLGMIEIFFALFGHAPIYVKILLVVRNALARLAGLDTSSVAEIMKPSNRGSYRVGEKIGPWPIFSLTEREIVAGRNNKHLDFRLSVLKQRDEAGESVIVSTICNVHNVFGRIYLFFITPFHRFGVRNLMSKAVAARRI